MISPEIIKEVADVLARPRTLKKFPGLSRETVDLFLDAIQERAIMFPDATRVFNLDRDPKDEPYINLAIVSGATYLVTWDRDLLDLMFHQDSRRQFPMLTILEPTGMTAVLRTL